MTTTSLFRFIFFYILFALSSCSVGNGEYKLPNNDSKTLTKDSATLKSLQDELTNIIKRASPSVVFITTSKNVSNLREIFPFRHPFFENFFKFFDQQNQGREEPFNFKMRGAGSGFVIDSKKGYILTNYHLIGGTEDISVVTHDNHEYKAKIIGGDELTDVAVLQVKGLKKNINRIILADHSKIEVGNWVLAIGAPHQLPQTITQGIVSAKGRSGFSAISGFGDFIQTDAAINPGNSGGPLLNIYGEAIGMNTFIISPTGASSGLGFAIPSNILRDVSQQLINHGKVERAYLGIYVQTLTPRLAKEFELKDVEGALITKVEKKSPAEKAGLKEGDVIVSVAGKKVVSSEQLTHYIGMSPVKKKVKMGYYRSGQRKTVDVKLMNLEERNRSIANVPEAETQLSWGMALETYDLRVHPSMGDSIENGVIIVNTAPGSIADMAGVTPGDIIVEVNRKKIKNLDDFFKYNNRRSNILLRIFREGNYFYVSLQN